MSDPPPPPFLLIQGKLFGKVVKNDSFWTIEVDKHKKERFLVIHLEKAEPISHWATVMVAESEELDATSEYEIAVQCELVDQAEEALKRFTSAADKGSVAAQLKLAAVFAVGKESIFPVDTDLAASFKSVNLLLSSVFSH